jgi:hypothetical protein
MPTRDDPRRVRAAASPLAALGLSVLLAFGPLVQPAAAQQGGPQTVPVTVTQGPTIRGNPVVTSVAVSRPATPNIEVSSCGGPRRIFQGCPIDGPAELRLESRAIDAVLDLNHLPDSDRGRVLTWARNDVRAMLFTNLVEAYKKEPGKRDADEAAAVTRLTQTLRDKRVTAATVAQNEFIKWNRDPCRYAPPAGFTYDRGTACARGANQLFGGPNPPSRADFQAYGAAAAYGRFASDESLRAVSGDTAKAYGTLAGLGAAVAASTAAGVVGSSLTVGTLTAVQPFLVSTIVVAQNGISVLGSSGAALASSASSATAASSAGVSGALSLAGPVAIIAVAIVVLAVQGANVIKAAELPGQLQSDLDAARSYDPSNGVRRSDKATTQEVYGAFLELTVPESAASEAVPAPQTTDPKLVVGGVRDRPMRYVAWDQSRHTARLSGDWWVDTDAAGKARLTLRIDYLDPSGEGWTASRRGTEFISRRASDAAKSSDVVAEVLTYQNWQNQSETASLKQADASAPRRTSPPPDPPLPKGPYVTVDPISQALAARTSTTLDVKASAGTGQLANWTVDITYDPAVVRVSDCRLGEPGVCNPSFGAHTVRIDGGTSRPIAGRTTLARITFTAVGPSGSTTAVGIKVSSLSDANGAPLKATTLPGQLEVE